MKVRYINESDYSLTNGKEYEVISIEKTYYRIVDNSGEDYLFPPEEFEILDLKKIFKIIHINQDDCWIYISAEGFDIEESEPFEILLEFVAKVHNGNIRSVGDVRFIIDTDELELIYQWDDLYGIVVDYSSKDRFEKAETFLKTIIN